LASKLEEASSHAKEQQDRASKLETEVVQLKKQLKEAEEKTGGGATTYDDFDMF
jgi:peptidoglycan hydrolase CwlO-like protein